MIRRVLFPALVFSLIWFSIAPAAGESLKNELDEIRQSVLAISAQIDDASAERSVLAQELVGAQERLDTVEIAVAAATSRLDRSTRVHAERSSALEAVRAELARQLVGLSAIRADRDEALDDAKASLLSAYTGGEVSQPEIAFSATAVADVTVGVAYLDVLADFRSGAADRYAAIVAVQEVAEAKVKTVEGAILGEIEALEAAAEVLRSDAADLEDKRAKLAADYEAQVILLSDIRERIAEFEGELTGLEREEAAIRAKIRAAAQPDGRKPGQLLRPVPGAIESGFGQRAHPIYGTVKMHNGIDFHGSMGDRIIAAGGGTVILAGSKGGYGLTVMIDHGGGMVTLYAHQSRLGVSVGDKVAAGSTIGYLGSTGLSTGPHLHFEVRISGVPVDPRSYI